MKYKKYFEKRGKVYNKKYKEIPEPKILDYKKGQVREDIEKNVFDINDSVADNAKMISILTSLISRIWKIIPDDQKANLSDEEKETIDTLINTFESITTWADIKWQEEGANFAYKLIQRQAKIGEIISNIYKG